MKIDELIKEAYKAHDNISLNAYRNIKSELQKVLTAKNAPEYSNELFLQVTAKYSKKLEDSISQFSEAHRDDLVADYTNELEVVKKLLPEPISADDIKDYLYDWCDEHDKIHFDEFNDSAWFPEYSKKEIGMIIKTMKEKFPTANGKMISDIVKQYVI